MERQEKEREPTNKWKRTEWKEARERKQERVRERETIPLVLFWSVSKESTYRRPSRRRLLLIEIPRSFDAIDSIAKLLPLV